MYGTIVMLLAFLLDVYTDVFLFFLRFKNIFEILNQHTHVHQYRENNSLPTTEVVQLTQV